MEKKLNADILRIYQKSPLDFIQDMWQIYPLKEGERFQKGKHISNDQLDILKAVGLAMEGKAKRRISIRSGHGIGKSTTCSWLILWFLFSFFESQISCTAPSSEQMYDVLWKEIAKWLEKMPDEIKACFEWSSGYIRIKQRPKTWFARARTARKESPEAFAGVHADHVFMLADEASGVADEIYQVAEGSLTDENILVILISNPTRLNGYFYDTHHSDRNNWQCLHFDSENSPLVDAKYVNRIIERSGEDSDEFRIRVKGEFPREDAIDDEGFVPLFMPKDIRSTLNTGLVGNRRMGVDPAASGGDETVWVIRDKFRAWIVAREKKSTESSIIEKTITLMLQYKLKQHDVFIDNFGVGANICAGIGKSSRLYPRGVNVGDKAEDEERFINMRAEAYFRVREWIRAGGEFIDDPGWDELLSIKYKRNLKGKIQMMSKDKMRKLGIKSPNCSDALMLTLVEPDTHYYQEKEKQIEEKFDKYDLI